MDENHPSNIDPKPKRRRAADNPYEIFSIGQDTEHPHFYLSFRDGGGAVQHMEIDKPLFDAFDQFELDDLSFMNEKDRHYEQSEQTENALNKRVLHPQNSVEEIVSRQADVEALHRAISTLPDVQRRRLVLYYFGELTYEQIAKMEGCTIMPIKRSVDTAIKKLKKFFAERG